jgi:HPt (histidine-containing phosphotransfer) domain-containing protein
MIGIFLTDTPLQIAELEKSLKSSDRAVFMRAAHSIKGSSSNLGAGALRDATERAENDSSATPIPQLAPLVAEIEAEFARARAELERIIAAGPNGQ